MNHEHLSKKTVIVDGKEIDKEIVHHCMNTVEQAVLDVVTHLVKNGAKKEDHEFRNLQKRSINLKTKKLGCSYFVRLSMH